jgi:peptidoglycan/xylan/chitin deacetylase (PgdA/CDA1 family)
MKRHPSFHPAGAKLVDTERREGRSVFARLGTYLPAMIILSMAVPMLIYLMFMKSVGWNLPVLGMSGALSYASPSSSTILLYTSSNSRTYFTGIGGNYDVLLGPWRNYFVSRKLDFKEVANAAQLRKERSGVLVLPSAVALSDEERFEIMAFRSKGGAILSTWATGTRDGSGGWQGWQFLERLGTRVVGEIPASAEVHDLILTGESPVSHTAAAGQRIELSKTSEALLRATGEMVAGRFMNWTRVTDDERRGEGAILFSESSEQSGRVAYFAFAESCWEAHTLDTYSVIDDTLQWLRREPLIIRAAWPAGKRAAQVIEMDTEEGFNNALPFASMMQSIGYRSTFYILTSVAKLFPQVLKQLARDFEIGYHGDVHISFKGQPAAMQEQRLQTMRNEMASVLPELQNVSGFRAPTEGYDAVTEQLLPKFGIRHHTADPNRSTARLPLLSKSEGVAVANALVVLPRTQRDDINLYLEKLTVEQTAKALIDDFDLSLDTGSLGLLSLHSQNFNADSVLLAAMPAYLEHLKQRREPLWLAPAGQVADWWRDRDRFKLSSSTSGKRLEFNVTITGTSAVNGATVIVMVPQKGVQAIVEGTKIGMVKPLVSRIDDYRAAIVFDALAPGSYFYQVTFSSK